MRLATTLNNPLNSLSSQNEDLDETLCCLVQSFFDFMKLKMCRIILFVDDIAKTTDFYENIIGLSTIGERDSEFVSFDAGGCQLCLHQIPSEYLEAGNKYEIREDSYTKVVFYSDNVERNRAELIAKGVRIKRIVKFDGIEICDGCDCEGNIFQISSR
jgi:catechol 2,3-dioxygenase-like lactoylglutathione lyase family enzyme